MQVKKIKVRLAQMTEKKLYITTPFIKLDSALKLSDIAPTGGIAKLIIDDEKIRVNGEKCTVRGKKLYPGDKFEYDNLIFEIAVKDEN